MGRFWRTGFWADTYVSGRWSWSALRRGYQELITQNQIFIKGKILAFTFSSYRYNWDKPRDDYESIFLGV